MCGSDHLQPSNEFADNCIIKEIFFISISVVPTFPPNHKPKTNKQPKNLPKSQPKPTVQQKKNV